MHSRMTRGLLVVLVAALLSTGTVLASLAWSSSQYSAETAIAAFRASEISMGEPRDMLDAEWDDVPLMPDRALAFSVGDLVGCYGCEDPMGYLLQYTSQADLDRDWQLAEANVQRSYAADWLWRYPGLMVILPAGLNQRQADVYRAALEGRR